jgi:hypothetical protein
MHIPFSRGTRTPDSDLLKLAIVIPTLNEAEHIQATLQRYLEPCTNSSIGQHPTCLDCSSAHVHAAAAPPVVAAASVVRQPGVKEVVVVDGGSSDGTASLARACGAKVGPLQSWIPTCMHRSASKVLLLGKVSYLSKRNLVTHAMWSHRPHGCFPRHSAAASAGHQVRTRQRQAAECRVEGQQACRLGEADSAVGAHAPLHMHIPISILLHGSRRTPLRRTPLAAFNTHLLGGPSNDMHWVHWCQTASYSTWCFAMISRSAQPAISMR